METSRGVNNNKNERDRGLQRDGYNNQYGSHVSCQYQLPFGVLSFGRGPGNVLNRKGKLQRFSSVFLHIQVLCYASLHIMLSSGGFENITKGVPVSGCPGQRFTQLWSSFLHR